MFLLHRGSRMRRAGLESPWRSATADVPFARWTTALAARHSVADPRPPLVCEWIDGDVSYQVRRPAWGATVLSALGPGTMLRVVPLRREDGPVPEWLAMTIGQRTIRAEGILQRD